MNEYEDTYSADEALLKEALSRFEIVADKDEWISIRCVAL